MRMGCQKHNKRLRSVLFTLVALIHCVHDAHGASRPLAVVPCKQRVRGQSLLYGPIGDSNAVLVDQARTAVSQGRLAKINTYISQDEGCIVGIKPIYGSNLGAGQLLGLQKGMREKSITLAVHEGVNRIDIKYDRRCIRYIRYYTNAGATETIGSSATSASSKLVVVLPQDSKWQLVSFRGTTVNDTLQQVQFVWGEVFCAEIPPLSLAPPPTIVKPAAAAPIQPEPAAAAAALGLSPSPPVQSVSAASPSLAPKPAPKPAASGAVPAAAAAAAALTLAAAEQPVAKEPTATAAAKKQALPTSAAESKPAAAVPAAANATVLPSPKPLASPVAIATSAKLLVNPTTQQAQQAAVQGAAEQPQAAPAAAPKLAAAAPAKLPAVVTTAVNAGAVAESLRHSAAAAAPVAADPARQAAAVAQGPKQAPLPAAAAADPPKQPAVALQGSKHAPAATTAAAAQGPKQALLPQPAAAAYPRRQPATAAAQRSKHVPAPTAAAAELHTQAAAATAVLPTHSAAPAAAAAGLQRQSEAVALHKAALEQQPVNHHATQTSAPAAAAAAGAAPAKAQTLTVEQQTAAAQQAGQHSYAAAAAAAATVHTAALEQQPADAQKPTRQQTVPAAAAADMDALQGTVEQMLSSAASAGPVPHAAEAVLPLQPSAVTLAAVPADSVATSAALVSSIRSVTVDDVTGADITVLAATELPSGQHATAQGQQTQVSAGATETPTAMSAAQIASTRESKPTGAEPSPAPSEHAIVSVALAPSPAILHKQPQQQQQGSSRLSLPLVAPLLQEAPAPVAPAAVAAAQPQLTAPQQQQQQHEHVQPQPAQMQQFQVHQLHKTQQPATHQQQQQQLLLKPRAPATMLSAPAAAVATATAAAAAATAAAANPAVQATLFADLQFGDSCQDHATGGVSLVGSTKDKGSFVDHTLLMLNGPLQSVSLYFSPSEGCLKGAKGVFGEPGGPSLAGMIGSSGNTKETVLRLAAGEVITKVDYKADNAAFTNNCILYIRLYTNRGRSTAAGLASSPLPTEVAVAGKGEGHQAHLVALKGVRDPNNGSRPGPLQQLQLVWGTRTCSTKQHSSMILDTAEQPKSPYQPAWYAFTPPPVMANGFGTSDPVGAAAAAVLQPAMGIQSAHKAVQQAVQVVSPVLSNARLSRPGAVDGSATPASSTNLGVDMRLAEPVSSTTGSTPGSTPGSTSGSLTATPGSTVLPGQQLGSLPSEQQPYALHTQQQQQQQLMQLQQQYSQQPGANHPVVQPLPPAHQSDVASKDTVSKPPAVYRAMVPPTVLCNAQPGSCNIQSRTGDPAYCAAVAPFTKPECVGGCCASTGKCNSGSCSASGLGAEVPSMMCYGLGGGYGYGRGSNSLCQNLGCRLALPGCLTGSFGGNCVGKVVALGPLSSYHPFVGYPCLDVMPSDTTLNINGTTSNRGYYMAKLWSVCNCNGAPTVQSPPPASTSVDGQVLPATSNRLEASLQALMSMFGDAGTAAQVGALLGLVAAAGSTSNGSNSGTSPAAAVPGIINFTNVTVPASAAESSISMADLDLWMNLLSAARGNTAAGGANDLASALSNVTANFAAPQSPSSSSTSLGSTSITAQEVRSSPSSDVNLLGALGNLFGGLLRGGGNSGSSLPAGLDDHGQVHVMTGSQAASASSLANQLLSMLTGRTRTAAIVPPPPAQPPLPSPSSPLPFPQNKFSLTEGLANFLPALQAYTTPTANTTTHSTTDMSTAKSGKDVELSDIVKVLPIPTGQGSSRGNSVIAAGLPPQLAAAAGAAGIVSAAAAAGLPSNARLAAAPTSSISSSSSDSAAVGTSEQTLGNRELTVPADLAASGAPEQQQQQQPGLRGNLLSSLLQTLAAAINSSSTTDIAAVAPTPQLPGLATSQQQQQEQEQKDPQSGSPLSAVLQMLAASALREPSPSASPAAAAITSAVVIPPSPVAAVDVTPVGAPFDPDAMQLPEPLAAAIAAYTATSGLQPAKQLAGQEPSTQQEVRMTYVPQTDAPVAVTSTSSRKDNSVRDNISSSRGSRDHMKGFVVREPAVNRQEINENMIYGAIPDSISPSFTFPVAAPPHALVDGVELQVDVDANLPSTIHSSNSDSSISASVSASDSALSNTISSRGGKISSSSGSSASSSSAILATSQFSSDSAVGSASNGNTTKSVATEAVGADIDSWNILQDASVPVSSTATAQAYGNILVTSSSSSNSSESSDDNSAAGTIRGGTSAHSSSAHANTIASRNSSSNTTSFSSEDSSHSQHTPEQVAGSSSSSTGTASSGSANYLLGITADHTISLARVASRSGSNGGGTLAAGGVNGNVKNTTSSNGGNPTLDSSDGDSKGAVSSTIATAGGSNSVGSSSSSSSTGATSTTSSNGSSRAKADPTPSEHSNSSFANASNSNSMLLLRSSDAAITSKHGELETPDELQVTPNAILPVELEGIGVTDRHGETQHTGDRHIPDPAEISDAVHNRVNSKRTRSRARRMLPKQARQQSWRNLS